MHQKTFIPSKYQLAVKDWLLLVVAFLTGNSSLSPSNAIVNAVPGSGKTSTLVWLTEFIPSTLRIAFLSFGRDIVKTLAARCPNAFCKTYNALGSRAIRAHLAGTWIKLHDGTKVIGKSLAILLEIYPKNSNGDRDKEYFMYSRFVIRLVSLAKNAGIGCLVADTYAAWEKLVAYHNLMLDSKAAKLERAIEIAQDVLRISNQWSRQGKIDFDDQLYLVSLWDLNLEKFDLVLVDESQDTNAIQVAMLKKLERTDGRTRYLFVGDEKQAIYGFRGADAHAMQKMREAFKAQDLKLSICYRCSRAVVDNANLTFPEVGMESAPNAQAGKVENLSEYNAKTFGATDAILCRNVAPLIKLAYSFILKGVACHVLGREIGIGLSKLVDRMNAENVDDLQDKLNEYREREVSKLLEKNRSGEAETINDQVSCILLFVSNLKETNRTIDALKAAIESLFSDRNGCLTLATIHKSKGLEFDKVFILDYALIPSKYATQDWQLEQERNLKWVANTRAKNELYYIESDCWNDDASNETNS